MAKEPPPSEKTSVVATYSNRRDAEIAKGVLEEEGISSFVISDDVHPPIQLTQGVQLVVMHSEAPAAREVVQRADMLPSGTEASHAQSGNGPAESLTFSNSAPVRTIAWATILLLLVLVIGLVLSTLV